VFFLCFTWDGLCLLIGEAETMKKIGRPAQGVVDVKLLLNKFDHLLGTETKLVLQEVTEGSEFLVSKVTAPAVILVNDKVHDAALFITATVVGNGAFIQKKGFGNLGIGPSL